MVAMLLTCRHAILPGSRLQTRDVPASRWQPWLDLLPAESLSLCQFSVEDSALLGTSLARDLSLGLQVQTETSAAEIQKHLRAVPRTEHWFSSEGFSWAHFILRSRTHRVGVQDADGRWHKAMCLVPVADLMNTCVQHPRSQHTNIQ